MVVELSGGLSLGLAVGVVLEVELEREAGFAVPDPPLAHGGLGTCAAEIAAARARNKTRSKKRRESLITMLFT
jgi:hypothetical protein